MSRRRTVTRVCAWAITFLASAALPAVGGGPGAAAGARAAANAERPPLPVSAAAANTLMLTNVQTGKCLTIAGGVSTDNNVTALQYDCDAHPSRRWTLRLAGPVREG
ncbi:RICIN domain-containing protein [Streptosporangium sp. NPDC001681]|uniref:RICIN domain-containing protein n=1 Tax=Streptosporangium sp. NPDC001681 TaxID=3154395 RepID=UPI0033211848